MSHINVEKKSIFAKKLTNVNNCILKIENLTLTYGNKKVLDDINLSVERGDIVTLLGPNGGGKTSLVKAVAGINKGYIGNIILADNVKISYMPQNFSIGNLMPITVEYFLLNSSSKRLKKDQSVVKEAIELVGISDILKNQVLEISAGQTQLLLLARCLISEPDLIILDEPVSAMDINARAKFYDIINKVAKEQLVSILMTSHDLNSVIPYSDYIICINNTIYYQGKAGKAMKLNEIFNSYVAK